MRRIPILPTLIVLIAAGIMIRLGFWQLDRLHQKEALLARYAAAESMSSEVAWPRDAAAAGNALYRRSRVTCESVSGISARAGENRAGDGGMAHVATCLLAGGGEAKVVLGWSRSPVSPDWRGGEVSGTVAPGPRLVADPPLAGLEANARPDPANIPNNHLSYAVQWFLFALTALTIYALALRKRLSA
ncbi:MAG: SURF1 family protein [Sphingomonadales bacterium]|nr:SURF1 family protein [Sphingomonadales bacterium]